MAPRAKSKLHLIDGEAKSWGGAGCLPRSYSWRIITTSTEMYGASLMCQTQLFHYVLSLSQIHK